MKTQFSIYSIIAALLYSCQNRSTFEGNIDADSLFISRKLEEQTLRKWLSLNKESDSIIAAAQLILDKHNQAMNSGKEGKNYKIMQKLNDLQFHLDEFKMRVNYIKDFESKTETFDQSVIHTLDSLKVDYLQEKLKIEAALCEFQEFDVHN